ncbi:MAG: 4-hydroxy-tetrahydrodipicolinate reductase [Candidatus Woesearchaeota archaeon]
MAKIGLIGYGRMGHIIRDIAIERGHEVTVIVDPYCSTVNEKISKEINEKEFKNVDVCIDFSHPDSAIKNAKKLAGMRKNVVMATTGWYGQMDEMKKIVKDSGIGFIWSGNFSIGVNCFFRIVKEATKIMNNVKEYDPFVFEVHHNKKADSPSGTANMIGKIVVDNLDRKDTIVADKLDRQIKENELHVASVRGGDVPGTHVVGFDSTFDTIELKHTARSRQGFGLGAVMAAEFLVGKKGFFEIDDLMDNLIDKSGN